MTKSLSKESEKRMMDALEKVATLISDGEHPNDALVKIASEMQIPAGHVQLLVNAVNTGSTNAHRLAHEDPREKAGEFPLADVSAVMKSLYPNNVKTKQASYTDSVVSKEYDRPPAWINTRKSFEKTSRVSNWKMTDKKLPIQEVDLDKVSKQAHAQVQRLTKIVEETRWKVTEVRQKAASVIETLRNYFKRPGNIHFDEVCKNASIMFGKQASIVLERVEPKVAQHKNLTSTPVNVSQAPYSLIIDAIKLAQDFKVCQEAHTAAVKTANSEAERLLRPFARGPVHGRSVMASQCSQQDLIKGGGIGSFLAKGLGTVISADIAREMARKLPTAQDPANTLERKDYLNLTDPSHENEIRNIQSEAMLNDLMANDDVIRGYDPEEVIDAYNEVNQLAPYAANKKVIMRDLMRKRLSGGAQALDQFTTGEAIKQQDALKTLSQPNVQDPQTMSVLKDLGLSNVNAQQSLKAPLG